MNTNLESEDDGQASVFVEALKIYSSRSHAYGEVWKQYGAMSNLLNAARKIDRLMNSWWHEDKDIESVPILHKDALDDAFDALNYLAFFIRSAREGNLTGAKPTRPVTLGQCDAPECEEPEVYLGLCRQHASEEVGPAFPFNDSCYPGPHKKKS